MRRVLITLLAITAVGAGAAFAQGNQYWAGISTGAPGTTVHFGVSDVAPSLSVRADLGYGYLGAFNGFTVGADGLYNLPINMSDMPVTVYAGLGPMIASSYNGDFGFGGNLFVGAEYRLGQVGFQPGGIFLEAGPNFMVAGGSFYTNLYAALGFNYHFGSGM